MNRLGRKHGHIVTEETRKKISIASSKIRTSIEKHCLVCNKIFLVRQSRLKIGKGKYCSQICTHITQKEEKSVVWKGDKAGYQALHIWIRNKLGKPNKCEDCGTTEKRWYEWANISRKYKRDIKDWKRLCRPCHNIYDKITIRAAITRREKYNQKLP